MLTADYDPTLQQYMLPELTKSCRTLDWVSSSQEPQTESSSCPWMCRMWSQPGMSHQRYNYCLRFKCILSCQGSKAAAHAQMMAQLRFCAPETDATNNADATARRSQRLAFLTLFMILDNASPRLMTGLKATNPLLPSLLTWRGSPQLRERSANTIYRCHIK